MRYSNQKIWLINAARHREGFAHYALRSPLIRQQKYNHTPTWLENKVPLASHVLRHMTVIARMAEEPKNIDKGILFISAAKPAIATLPKTASQSTSKINGMAKSPQTAAKPTTPDCSLNRTLSPLHAPFAPAKLSVNHINYETCLFLF